MEGKHCECCGKDCGCCGGGSSPLSKGLAVMFILIGLAVFVSSVLGVLLNRTSVMNYMMSGFGTGGLWNIIGLVFALCILFWIFRNISHRHGRCSCGCVCCGKEGHGRCGCGDDCKCGCNGADGMDKKVARRKRSR